jgi:parallel beta-helix repeat protein
MGGSGSTGTRSLRRIIRSRGPAARMVLLALLVLSACALLRLPPYTEPRPAGPFDHFRAAHGESWRAKWNRSTGAPSTLYGGSIPVVEPLTSQNVERVAREFLGENSLLLKTDNTALELTDARYVEPIRPDQRHGVWWVTFRQRYNDIPVYGATTRLVINNQRITKVVSDFYPGVDVDATPGVTAAGAAEIVNQDIGGAEQVEPLETELVVLPIPGQGEARFHLAYRVVMPTLPVQPPDTARIEDEGVVLLDLADQWIYFIDAHEGDVLLRYDNSKFDAASGRVMGKVFAEHPGAPQIDAPVRSQYVHVLQDGQSSDDVVTDSEGQFVSRDDLSGSVTIEADLSGPYVLVHNDEAPDQQASYISGPLPLPVTGHEWNWGDETTDYDPSPNNVETNVFYHVNWIHDWFLRGGAFSVQPDPNPMPCSVRVTWLKGNARATDDGLLFGVEYPGVSDDLGLGTDIIYHEYTHRVVDRLYEEAGITSMHPDFQSHLAMHEAWADYFGSSILDNPGVGEGVFNQRLREIDMGEYQGALPEDGNRRYPRDWYRAVGSASGTVYHEHRNSLILSGALWDLRKELGSEYVDDLAMRAMWDGPTTFSDYLVAILGHDDGDGNLANGTPNVETICQTFFDLHGIYCEYCRGLTESPLATISSPEPPKFRFYPHGGLLVTDPSIEIVGSAAAGDTPVTFSVAYATDEESDVWSDEGMVLANGGAGDIQDGVLATWTFGPGPDGLHTVRLTVEDEEGDTALAETSVYLLRMLHPGWPQLVDKEFHSSPAVGDIDPDVEGLEIAAADGYGMLYLFHHDGTPAAGSWPKQVGSYKYTASLALGDVDPESPGLEVVAGGNAYDADGSAVGGWPIDLELMSGTLADFDGDGYLELAGRTEQEERQVLVSVWNHDGTPVAGWPKTLEAYSVELASGDVDNDGVLDIVAVADLGTVHVWDSDGNDAEGWPQDTDRGTAPALGDPDDDGCLELVLGPHISGPYDVISMLNHDGTITQGWPVRVLHDAAYCECRAAPILANVDGDPEPEAIAITYYGGTLRCAVRVYDADGTSPEGWTAPATPRLPRTAKGFTSPIAADIDGDGFAEIVTSGQEMYAINHDGTLVDGWPRSRLARTLSTPTLTDVDGDGSLELIAAGKGLFVWDIGGTSGESEAEWATGSHDTQRTGRHPYRRPAAFVDPVDGDDGYDGRSSKHTGGEAGPKRTIQAGLDVTPPGGICHVAPGSYPENIVIQKDVTLAGAGPGISVIAGSRAPYAVVVGTPSEAVSKVVVEGFTISNWYERGAQAGLSVSNSSTDVVIRRNVILENPGGGIHVYDCSPAIINNTIVRNGGYGIKVHGASNPTIMNNIIADTRPSWAPWIEAPEAWGLWVDVGVPLTHDFNNYWNNAMGDYQGCTRGFNDCAYDPKFVAPDAGDFHLMPSSPLINRGTDVGLPWLGFLPEIGAFEFEEEW